MEDVKRVARGVLANSRHQSVEAAVEAHYAIYPPGLMRAMEVQSVKFKPLSAYAANNLHASLKAGSIIM